MGNREWGSGYGEAGMGYGDTLPIAALATARGESALALIRISGTGSLERLASVFSRPEAFLCLAGNRVIHGWIIKPSGERIGSGSQGSHKADSEDRLDEVLITCYRSPRSYTGEDGADISCHGGVSPARAILGALRAVGFREALPGEFTFRAFMNGKLDLTRAESVMELVASKTDRGRQHAIGRLSGVLEVEIEAIKGRLVQVLAGAELFLDYSEDEAAVPPSESGLSAAVIDDEAAGRLPDRAGAEEVRRRLERLAAAYRRERLYQEGALAVIAGRPNAGKSSLFNLLLREDRSIVTDIPGTTRDWIEAGIALEGIPIRLADTAGLHASEDPVERLGMERSRELLDAADLILYLLDGGVGITQEDRDFFSTLNPQPIPRNAGGASGGGAKPPFILLWNKADLLPMPASLAVTPEFTAASAVLGISAKTGAGLGELAAAMTAALEAGNADQDGSSAAPGTLRQKELIDVALEAVTEALALADQGGPLDIIAPLLRQGVNALGEITGEVSTAEILETMFSKFCVGK